MKRRELPPRLEAGAVWLVFHLFRLLPLDLASSIGGWIGRAIGYRLAVTRRARRNLARVMPDLPPAEREAIIRGMWDNLGRTAAEYPHLAEFRFGPGERVEVQGLEHVLAVRDDGKPGLFFSGHLGNWELMGFCGVQYGLPLHLVYRATNNPHLGWVYSRGRVGELIPKGPLGARRALELLRSGEHLGMLIDQKMNDGIAVPFFGIDAMTAPALASFALKFGCPVVPAHVERLGGARFRLIIEPPLAFADSDDRHAAIAAATAQVNRILEGWVRAHPDQWLWLHRRWPE